MWTYVFISLMRISKSKWINRSNGNYVFNFFRNCLTSFHSGCTILYSHQQLMWVLIFLHPHQHWLFSIFQGFFFFFGHTTRHVGSWFFNQGSNPGPLQWKCRVWTTGPPMKSLVLFCFVIILDHPSRYKVVSHCGFDMHFIGD